jgi:hypothetical protein
MNPILTPRVYRPPAYMYKILIFGLPGHFREPVEKFSVVSTTANWKNIGKIFKGLRIKSI